MKKINLWIGLIALIFTFTSCDEMGNLFGGNNNPGDIKLKFTDMPVEQVKQQLESEGIDFMDELMGLQETQLFPIVEYALELLGDNENQTNGEALRSLAYGLRKSPVQAGFTFHKQMRVNIKNMNELWGFYAYDFETNQIIKLQDSYNEIDLDFPSSAEQQSNDAKLILGVIDSDLPIDWLEEDTDPYQDPNQKQNPNPNQIKYPERIYLSIRINNKEIFYADIYAQYSGDGVPKKLRQSLKLEAYKWVTEVENTGRKITEKLRLNKGDKRLVLSEAVIQGNFSREIIENEFKSDKNYPDELFDSFSGMVSVMDIAVQNTFVDFKGFYNKLNEIDKGNYSVKESAEKEVEAFNKHMKAAAYFVSDKKKFAEIEVDAYEYQNSYYEIVPVFVLSDKSRVLPDEFVTEGFDNLFIRIEEILKYFVYVE